MSETEVYQAVAKLFHDEEDLMLDFKTYLPDVGVDNTYKQHQLENLAKIEQTEKTALGNLETSPKTASLQTKKRPLESPQNNSSVMPKVNIKAFKIYLLQIYYRNYEPLQM